MNIEEAREYAHSLPRTEESLFSSDWVQYKVCGKWFMLIWLNVPEQRVAVKCNPDLAIELRERYKGVEPAYHMNKRMWNDLYLCRDLDDEEIKRCIRHSYDEVVNNLPRKIRKLLGETKSGAERNVGTGDGNDDA